MGKLVCVRILWAVTQVGETISFTVLQVISIGQNNPFGPSLLHGADGERHHPVEELLQAATERVRWQPPVDRRVRARVLSVRRLRAALGVLLSGAITQEVIELITG